MNIKKTVQKFYLRIVSTEGTPESVGRGMAIGLFIGMILPIGLQTPPALFFAFLFKANKVLTWLFTCISNPATVFFLYPIQCYVGSLVAMKPLDYSHLQKSFDIIAKSATVKESMYAFLNLGADIVVSFFVGGIVLGLPLAIGGYFFGVWAVNFYRAQRAKRKLKKLARLRAKMKTLRETQQIKLQDIQNQQDKKN